MTTDIVDADATSPLPRRRVRSPALTVLAHAALIVASIAMLYPLLWMLAASFRPENEIFSTTSIIPSSVSLDAYVKGWNGLQVSFATFFRNSFIVALASVAGNLFACSLTAYAFARLNFWGKRIWFALMLGTLMVPYQVTLIPQYVLFRHLGWVDTFLPLIVPKFLAVDSFFIFLMVQFFRGIPRELDEAALIDGCNRFQIYWRIMLPLSIPVLVTAGIFTFIFTWDDFFGPLIYLNSVENYTVTLALRGFVDASSESNFGALFAMSILALLPVFVFFLFFQRLLIQGIATTGLK